MKKELQELLKKRAEAWNKMKNILENAKKENRNLNEDEAKEYDGLDTHYEQIEADIKRLEKAIKREEELNKTNKPPLVGGSNNGTQKKKNPTDVETDIKRYSLFRAIEAMRTGDWSKAEYERELSIKIADNLGRDAKGLFVPYSVQRQILNRDVTATKAGNGLVDAGALVGTDHRDDLFIESLQADAFVVKYGAKVLTGLVGDVDIPRSLGGLTFNWIEENGDANNSNPNLDSITLKPKTISGAVPITRRLLKQSSPSIEGLLQDDIRKGVALTIDKATLIGAGGTEPVGILNTTGVSTVDVADDSGILTFKEAVKFETALAEANALKGTPIYVTTPTIAGAAKTKPIDSGSGIMLNTDNKINGYPVVPTTLMSSGKTIFGNFEDVIIGMWGVLDLVVDTATLAASGGIVLRVFQDVDVAIRHPQSFAVSV